MKPGCGRFLPFSASQMPMLFTTRVCYWTRCAVLAFRSIEHRSSWLHMFMCWRVLMMCGWFPLGKFLKLLNWGATRSNLVVPPLWSFRLWKHPKLRYLDVVDVVTLMTWPGFDTYRGIYRGQDAAQRRKSVSAWTNLHKACETMRTLSPTL